MDIDERRTQINLLIADGSRLNDRDLEYVHSRAEFVLDQNGWDDTCREGHLSRMILLLLREIRLLKKGETK